MKILSHIRQLEDETKKSICSESEKSCYKGFEKDGNGNTRLKPELSVYAHLDYTRIKIPGISPERMESLLCYISKNFVTEMDKLWSPGRGAVSFSNRLIADRGVKGGFNIDEETGLINLMIDLPGEYFEGKDIVDQWRLCKGLVSHFEAVITRVDTAIDDPSYFMIPVVDMVDACEQGYNFGFRKIGYHSSGSCGDCQSETYNFGSRESGKFVRIYDHDGDCLRFESEFKRGYANLIFKEFASLERPEGMSNEEWGIELQKFLASVTVGAIDFRDRGDRQDKSRAGRRDSVRLPFYQNFLDLLQAVHYRIKLPKVSTSISQSIQWIKRQCAPTLSMMRQGLGACNFDIFMKEALKEGAKRLDNKKVIGIKVIAENPRLYMV